MLLTLPIALALAGANLLIAWRSLYVVMGSRTAIVPRGPDAAMPSLSIVVPARDEERNIGRCARSLLATEHPDFELIVVDDGSTDGTGAILDAIAAEDARLRVVAGAPLPEGWVGKPWALAQGASLARGRWLLFTDADTQHEPRAAASAQHYAIAERCEVVSLLPDQETLGLAERLFLPTILFTIMLGVGSLDDVNDPRKPDVAIFNGQYILASRAAYDAIGGHAAVRGEIAEDLELARLFKRDGRFRIRLAGASALVRTRMYASFAELWSGFVKNFAVGSRGRLRDAVIGFGLLACVSPLTPLAILALAAAHRWTEALVLALSLAAVVAIAETGMRRIRFRPGAGLAVPLGFALVLAIAAVSFYRVYLGRGVEWRGRRYGGGLPAER